MKRILYIGNKLAGSGATATTIDTLGPLLQQEGYEMRYASSITHMGKRLLHMMRMTYLSRNWADVVLIDTYSTRNFWYAITISRICHALQMKYIPILHGGNLTRRLEKNPKTMSTFLQRAHKIVSPSTYLGAAFAKAGFTDTIQIHNFIELANYPFLRREIIRPRLLWVRSFAKIYHPEMAIRVLEKLKTTHPEASLTMVGPEKDGSLVSCRQLANDLGVDVVFTGLLTKKQWIEISKEHDIFINTTHFDNLPVSIIEAMALGLPVVSTEVGGIPFLIDHHVNGILTADSDENQMVDAIEKLLSDGEMVDRLTRNAYQGVTDFSWEKVKLKWHALLES